MITAKFKVGNHKKVNNESTEVQLWPDYNDERNKAWSQYTPSGSVSLVILDKIVEQFPVGHNFLLTFEDEDEAH
jgi:hypothetical protein